MNYFIIAGVIIALLAIYTIVSTANSKKKAPEKLSNAKRLFANGDSNAALRELGKAFALPMGDKITPEYNKHLLGVLDLLKEILDGMNISSDTLLTKLYKRLNEGTTKTIELQENLYKPVQEFFENTESDEKLAAFLSKAVVSGNIAVVTEEADSPRTSNRTTEYINRAGKFALKGEPQKGIEVYEEALSQSWEQHDEAFLYDQLGSFHLMNKDLAAAETNYKKSISIEPYFTNVWNYCDFLAYHKRIEDAKAQLPLLTSVIRTKSDQKEYDSLFKKFPDLK
jgi:tetratricopeptide (TPR) repeat protein